MFALVKTTCERSSLSLAGRISGARIDGKDYTYNTYSSLQGYDWPVIVPPRLGDGGCDGGRFFAHSFLHRRRLITRFARNNKGTNNINKLTANHFHCIDVVRARPNTSSSLQGYDWPVTVLPRSATADVFLRTLFSIVVDY